MDNYESLGIKIPYGRTGGNVKTICPHCNETRHNKRDKSLSVNLDSGLYNCHYCNWSGCAKENKEFTKMEKVYKRPQWNNKTQLSNKLVKWFEDQRSISQNTLQKLRITEGVEYMPQKNGKCNTVQFNYFLGDDLVNVKYRTGDKCFKLSSGAELILYNINSLIGSKTCIITEGEIDCASFIECGYDSVVSVPNGANNTEYLDNYIEDYFDDKETIYIAVDTDKKGLAFRGELIRRFGAERCKIVTYGEGCKDANEHLIKFGQKSLQSRIDNAEDIKIEGVFRASDYTQELDALYENGFQRGFTIGHSVFDDLCSFELGRLVVVTGIPGHGKSEFVDEIAVLLNLRYDFKFAYFSPENYPATYLYSKLTSKLTGKSFDKEHLSLREYNEAKTYINDNFFTIYPKEDFTLDEILAKAKYLVKKRGIKGLIIDPYNKLESRIPQGMNETNYISKQLDDLVSFAQKNNVLVFLVAHPRKMQIKDGKPESPSLYDINGSANFFNKTDFGLTVYRDRAENTVYVDIHKVKFKHLGGCGTARFKYNAINGRYIPFVDVPSLNYDYTNFLTERRKKIENAAQTGIDFTSKTPEDLEKDFLSEPLSKDQVPF